MSFFFLYCFAVLIFQASLFTPTVHRETLFQIEEQVEVQPTAALGNDTGAKKMTTHVRISPSSNNDILKENAVLV